MTDFQIYLIKGANLERKIQFSRLRGITYSKTNPREMIIHVKNEEDIYFQDEDLGEIEEVVKYVYFKHHSLNIPVFGVQENSLEIFMTTNDDVKYGINILPNDHFQDFDRDKYIEADWDESKSVTDIDDASVADFEGQNDADEAD